MPVYPCLAKAVGLAEAVFLERFLFMWTAKKGMDEEGQGGWRVYERKPGWGIYLLPKEFCRATGLSKCQFVAITKQYEKQGIFKTRIDNRDGNKKYYRPSGKRLQEYLTERVDAVWEEVVEYGHRPKAISVLRPMQEN